MVEIKAEVTIEVLSKDKKVLSDLLKNFAEAIKKNMKKLEVIDEEFGKPKKVSLEKDALEMWSGFVILTVKTTDISSLFDLYLAYLGPIRIDIIEPNDFKVSIEEMQDIFDKMTAMLQHIQINQMEARKKILGIE